MTMNISSLSEANLNMSSLSEANLNISSLSEANNLNTSSLSEANVNISSSSEEYHVINPLDVFILSISVTPDVWITHTGAVITYIVIALNAVVVSAFLRRDFISPSTIILAALAFSDTIGAICLFLPKHFGFLFHQLEYGDEYNVTVRVVSRYPYCKFVFWLDTVLIGAFHSISLTLTTLLVLQKTFVIAFPIMSRLFVSRKTSTISVLLTFMILLINYLPFGLMFHFREKGEFCEISYENWVIEYYSEYIFILGSLIYISTTVLLTICSIYISVKLTCRSTTIQRTETERTRNLHRRSAVMVVLIVIIFIISELLSIMCMVQVTLTKSDFLCNNAFYDFSDLSLVVGFAANYFVYLSISKQLRSNLTRHLQCCCPLIKKQYMHNIRSSNISHGMGDRY